MNDYSGYYFLIPQKEEHLSHHGIKGQKWGVKHGPPYPLQGENRVQRTGGLEGYALGIAYDLSVGAARKGIARVRVHSDDKRRAKNENIDKKTGFRLKDKDYSTKQDVKRINPGYAKGASGVGQFLRDKKTTNNCVYCTTAYELRKRGYDVRAKKAEQGIGLTEGEVDRLWKQKSPRYLFEVPSASNYTATSRGLVKKNTRKDRVATYEKTVDWIKKQPDQRGNLAVHWGLSGHSMAYEIKGGKLTILDCQNGKIYSNGEKYLKELYGTGIFSDLYTSDCSFRRTDNATPNWDEIKKRVE